MEVFLHSLLAVLPRRVQRHQLHLQKYHKEQASAQGVLRRPQFHIVPAGFIQNIHYIQDLPQPNC